MVNIIKKRWKNKTSYYAYDNIYDDKNKEYRKKYLGEVNKEDYEKYLEEQNRKKSNPNYCRKCGKRIGITLPHYLRDRIDICRCGV